MKTCVISASLGNYDAEYPYAEQELPEGVALEVVRLNDFNFPLRSKAMTPALQCSIPKWFGWDFTDADVIIWLDASVALTQPDNVANWLKELGNADLCVFRHSERDSVQQEYEFITQRMQRPNERYLTKRYSGEWLTEQYDYICTFINDPDLVPLYATTAFAYRPTRQVQEIFKEAFFGKCRWLLHDQLYFAFALYRCQHLFVMDAVKTMPYNYMKCPQLMEFVRNKK